MLTKIISSALLTTLFAVAPLREAAAGSCESGTKVAEDIWREHDIIVKALGCAVVSIASTGSVPPNACLDAADKVAKVTQDMLAFWNKAAGNSWAKIGPRRLDADETLGGKLVSTGGRMFITPTPLDSKSAEVRIKKLDGKAKTEVTVCKEHRGKYTKLWSFVIENGKANEGEVWKKTFAGVKGHNIVVHLDAKSVTNAMKYELRLNKQ
jgi:hypothetical protein